MESPRSEDEARCLRHLPADANRSEARVLFAPYRICPIGAHIDHQGGTVLGQAIDVGTTLAFAPRADDRIHVHSENYEGLANTAVSDAEPVSGWGQYVWAAARALADDLGAKPRGIEAVACGSLPGGGLSSSASFLLAIQTALLAVNDIELDELDRVRAAWRAETEFVGLQCGILDQTSIVAARADHLLAIDAARETWQSIAAGHAEDAARFLVCFSGAERNLVTTGFNTRVAQCREAAAELARLAGAPASRHLGDHDTSVFEEFGAQLSPELQRRATHFFGERERVADGIEAWRRGDLEAFGAAMQASCRSSIENFEVGTPELLTLQEILETTPGILGSRFSGAGFAGCVLALADGARADEARERVERTYAARVPALAENARFFLVRSGDGVRFA